MMIRPQTPILLVTLTTLGLVLTGFCSNSIAQNNPEQTKSAKTKNAKAKSAKAKTNQPQRPANRASNKPKATNQRPNARQTSAKKPDVQKPAPINKARLAELSSFVKQHHPEIRPLLKTLKKNRPDQYKATIQALDRDVRSLQNLKSRAPERYKKSLALWITKSRIKLLSAQLALKETEPERRKIRRQLRALFAKHFELRSQILSSDAQATKARLERLNTQLAKLKNDRADNINRQMDSINRNAKRISDNRNAKRISDNRKRTAPATQKKPGKKKQPPNNPRKNDKEQTTEKQPTNTTKS